MQQSLKDSHKKRQSNIEDAVNFRKNDKSIEEKTIEEDDYEEGSPKKAQK